MSLPTKLIRLDKQAGTQVFFSRATSSVDLCWKATTSLWTLRKKYERCRNRTGKSFKLGQYVFGQINPEPCAFSWDVLAGCGLVSSETGNEDIFAYQLHQQHCVSTGASAYAAFVWSHIHTDYIYTLLLLQDFCESTYALANTTCLLFCTSNRGICRKQLLQRFCASDYVSPNVVSFLPCKDKTGSWMSSLPRGFCVQCNVFPSSIWISFERNTNRNYKFLFSCFLYVFSILRLTYDWYYVSSSICSISSEIRTFDIYKGRFHHQFRVSTASDVSYSFCVLFRSHKRDICALSAPLHFYAIKIYV